MYLITTSIKPPFLTNWFDSENHFNPQINMIVYDLAKCMFTTDGVNWVQLDIDHL